MPQIHPGPCLNPCQTLGFLLFSALLFSGCVVQQKRADAVDPLAAAIAAERARQRAKPRAAGPEATMQVEAWPALDTAAAGDKIGARDAALIVAIENYDYIPGVEGARSNAIAWERWLKDTLGVPHVKLMIDREAKHGWTRGKGGSAAAVGVLKAVSQMSSLVQPKGKLWFVFIGHGGPSADGKDGLLLGADVEQKADSFESKGIPVQGALLPALAKAPQAVAVLDACFSGLDNSGARLVPGLQPALHAQISATPRGLTVLTAAKADQFAGPLPGAPRPAFSYLALGALRGWADHDNNGAITADEVQRYTRAKLLTLVTGRTQEPELVGEGALVLARGAREAEPQMKALPPSPPPKPQGLEASASPSPIPVAKMKISDLKRLAAEADARKHAEEVSRQQRQARFDEALERDWADTKPLLARGDAFSQQALVVFLARWGDPQHEDLEFPNRFAGEARRVYAGSNFKGEWVKIEGGTFEMGSRTGEKDEQPVHLVQVNRFEISKTEVTVAQYRACVDAGVCSEPDAEDDCNWAESGREDHPINCVNWEQAKAFASWVGARLPTEAEWEYAARSQGQAHTYPWGNAQALCDYAVMDDGGKGCGQYRTWPVCSKTRGNTEQGLCDMAGNVWEWVADYYADNYDTTPRDGTEHQLGSLRVSRGGSKEELAPYLRATFRTGFGPRDRSEHLGFRLAR